MFHVPVTWLYVFRQTSIRRPVIAVMPSDLNIVLLEQSQSSDGAL